MHLIERGGDLGRIHFFERQCQHCLDAPTQSIVGTVEIAVDRGIGNSPMYSDGRAVPDGARLPGGVVADRNYNIDRRCVVTTKPVPGLGLEALDAMSFSQQFVDGARIDAAGGMAACAARPQLAATQFVDQHFAEYAARGIARA